MATVKPQGQNLKQAVAWVSEKKKENPGTSRISLVDEACTRFDLSPEDSEFLMRFVRESEKKA